jgi:hypothetical protein
MGISGQFSHTDGAPVVNAPNDKLILQTTKSPTAAAVDLGLPLSPSATRPAIDLDFGFPVAPRSPTAPAVDLGLPLSPSATRPAIDLDFGFPVAPGHAPLSRVYKPAEGT